MGPALRRAGVLVVRLAVLRDHNDDYDHHDDLDINLDINIDFDFDFDECDDASRRAESTARLCQRCRL
jgi:hypothetical protein